MERHDAAYWLADAERRRARSRESWERSGTDGCVSQWCDDKGALESEARATICENGGRSTFPGLYDGDRRVAAKLVRGRYPEWRPKLIWVLRDEEAERYGRRFIPYGARSRVQKELGLAERSEWAPAWAKLDGEGTGLSGLATLRVRTYRTGDEWGADAELETEEEEA